VGSTTKYGDKRTGEQGAAAVEFALVVPLLLMLVFGIVDFGYMVNRVSMLNNAARDAAREGSLAGTQASITATATAALDGVPGVTVTVTCRKPDGTSCASYDADATSGGTAVVTISYEHEMITPISFIFGDSVNLSRTARMRIE
jgi:Flp pilus assembly protein TadG